MAILQRVEPVGYRWTPTAVPDIREELYSGRHRRDGRRRFSLAALFYVRAHAHYVPRHANVALRRAEYVARHRR